MCHLVLLFFTQLVFKRAVIFVHSHGHIKKEKGEKKEKEKVKRLMEEKKKQKMLIDTKGISLNSIQS